MWKSTSSNGWEYFIMWKDLGSSPMYAKLYIILICSLFSMLWLNELSDNVILKF